MEEFPLWNFFSFHTVCLIKRVSLIKHVSSFSSGAHVPAAPLVCSAVFGASACHSSPLAPIGTLAMPSCQWVLIIEDWPDCMAAGSRITYGTSGASNQLLSARGNGDLIKSMVHWCCHACTPHNHAEMWGCTWRTAQKHTGEYQYLCSLWPNLIVFHIDTTKQLWHCFAYNINIKYIILEFSGIW